MNKDLLFHYTSLDVLRCLMESVEQSDNKDCFCFYASNIFFMNDPSEFVFGGNLFVKEIRKIEDDLGINDNLRISSLWKDQSIEGEKKYIDYLQKHKYLPFAISFSSAKDSLPMWLNYANNGKGVCLAFADLRFNSFCMDSKLSTNHNVSEVYYGKVKKNSLLYDTMRNIMKVYKEDVNARNFAEMKNEYFDALIQSVAPFIKSNSYQNEQEIRLVQTIGYDYFGDESKIKFRCNANGNIIPYIPIEINTSLLKYIIVGPLANYELAKMAINMMIGKFLNKQVDIIPSRAVFRNY